MLLIQGFGSAANGFMDLCIGFDCGVAEACPQLSQLSWHLRAPTAGIVLISIFVNVVLFPNLRSAVRARVLAFAHQSKRETGCAAMDAQKLSRVLPTKQEAYEKRVKHDGWFYSIGAGLYPVCFVAWLYYASRRTITPFLWSYLAGLVGSGFVLGAIISSNFA